MFIRKIALLVCLLMPVTAHATPPVQVIKTPSGITAWLIEDHSLPMVTMRGVFRHGGAAYADQSKPGLPILSTHMLTEGAGGMGSEAFNTAIQDEAINLGFDLDYDHFSFGVSALSDHFNRGLSLLSLAMTKPRLEADDLTRVKEELKTERKLRLQSPGYLADQLFRRTVYENHPYAESLYAEDAALDGYKADDIRRWLKRTLYRGDMLIAVVGDITPATLSSELEKQFSAIAPGPSERADLARQELPLTDRIVKQTAPFPQTVAIFAVPGMERNDPDFYAAYLMNYILGGGNLDARLTTEVRKKRGLTYSVATGLVTDDASLLLKGSLSTKNEQAAEAVQVTRDVFQNAYGKGFTEAELQQAKDYVTGSFPLDIDANSELVNFLLVMEMKNLPKNYLDIRNDLMKKVTVADVNRVAKRLLDPSRLVVVTMGGEPKSAPAPAKEDTPKPDNKTEEQTK